MEPENAVPSSGLYETLRTFVWFTHHERQREDAAIEQQLFHLQAKRFPTPEVAQEALVALATELALSPGRVSNLSEHKRYAGKGRPTPNTPLQGDRVGHPGSSPA